MWRALVGRRGDNGADVEARSDAICFGLRAERACLDKVQRSALLDGLDNTRRPQPKARGDGGVFVGGAPGVAAIGVGAELNRVAMVVEPIGESLFEIAVFRLTKGPLVGAAGGVTLAQRGERFARVQARLGGVVA